MIDGVIARNNYVRRISPAHVVGVEATGIDKHDWITKNVSILLQTPGIIQVTEKRIHLNESPVSRYVIPSAIVVLQQSDNKVLAHIKNLRGRRTENAKGSA